MRRLAFHLRSLALTARFCALSVLASACGPGGTGPAETVRPARAADQNASTAGGPDPDAERYEWEAFTRSPQNPAGATSEVPPPCASEDAALQRVAARIADRELRGASSLEVAEVTFALRAEGGPYVWPRIWTLRGKTALAEAPALLAAWSSGHHDAGEQRCGIASKSRAGDAVVAALSVGVLADLEPLPTEVRIGEWLDVRARLHEPSAEAAVLVLGPQGSPHRVPAALDAHGQVRARFRADREGTWLVQVLADVAGGPRPVAEALLFAGSDPSLTYAAQPAPGETAGGATDPAASVAAMANAARASDGLRALARDARLDRAALAHSQAMQKLGRVAHDANDGTPGERARAAGVDATLVGENVAHARTVEHAHRALWASPSHRANLLEPNYDSVGVGVTEDADGSVWVSELFAKLGRAQP